MNLFRKYFTFIAALATVYSQQVQANDSDIEYLQEVTYSDMSDFESDNTNFACSSCNQRCCKETPCCYLTFDSFVRFNLTQVGGGTITGGQYTIDYLLTDPSGCSRFFLGTSGTFDQTTTVIPLSAFEKKLTTAKACCGSYQLTVIVGITYTSATMGSGLTSLALDPTVSSLEVTTLCPKKIDVSSLMINPAQFNFPASQAGVQFTIRYDFPEFVFAPNGCILRECCNPLQ